MVFGLLCVFLSTNISQGQQSNSNVLPTVPKTWDEEALASMTLPSSITGGRILYVSSSYYYSIPILPIYKSYLVYAPGKEPVGYLDWLKKQKPEIVFDVTKLESQAEWVAAGGVIFDTPFDFGPINEVRDPNWYQKVKPPVTKEGTI